MKSNILKATLGLLLSASVAHSKPRQVSLPTPPDPYDVTVFAEYPNVTYVVALNAAPDGSLYASIDKNASVGQEDNMGKVVRCIDTDDDGKADKFVDFVKSVDGPRNGNFVDDTFYLIHQPYLSSYRDTDGDGEADEHKVLVTGVGFKKERRGADHTTCATKLNCLHLESKKG